MDAFTVIMSPLEKKKMQNSYRRHLSGLWLGVS